MRFRILLPLVIAVAVAGMAYAAERADAPPSPPAATDPDIKAAPAEPKAGNVADPPNTPAAPVETNEANAAPAEPQPNADTETPNADAANATPEPEADPDTPEADATTPPADVQPNDATDNADAAKPEDAQPGDAAAVTPKDGPEKEEKLPEPGQEAKPPAPEPLAQKSTTLLGTVKTELVKDWLNSVRFVTDNAEYVVLLDLRGLQLGERYPEWKVEVTGAVIETPESKLLTVQSFRPMLTGTIDSAIARDGRLMLATLITIQGNYVIVLDEKGVELGEKMNGRKVEVIGSLFGEKENRVLMVKSYGEAREEPPKTEPKPDDNVSTPATQKPEVKPVEKVTAPTSPKGDAKPDDKPAAPPPPAVVPKPQDNPAPPTLPNTEVKPPGNTSPVVDNKGDAKPASKADPAPDGKAKPDAKTNTPAAPDAKANPGEQKAPQKPDAKTSTGTDANAETKPADETDAGPE